LPYTIDFYRHSGFSIYPQVEHGCNTTQPNLVMGFRAVHYDFCPIVPILGKCRRCFPCPSPRCLVLNLEASANKINVDLHIIPFTGVNVVHSGRSIKDNAVHVQKIPVSRYRRLIARQNFDRLSRRSRKSSAGYDHTDGQCECEEFLHLNDLQITDAGTFPPSVAQRT